MDLSSLVAGLPPTLILVAVIVWIAVREVRRAAEQKRRAPGRSEAPPPRKRDSPSNGSLHALRSLAEVTGAHAIEQRVEKEVEERNDRRRILELVERHDEAIGSLAASVAALAESTARGMELHAKIDARLEVQTRILGEVLVRISEPGSSSRTLVEMDAIDPDRS